MSRWTKAQDWERNWWGNCVNTYSEETKQLVYARKLNLPFDLQGKSVIDLGGGPVSLLLKCSNFSKAKVIDPCKFPDWVYERYKCAGIEFEKIKAEEMREKGWDIVLDYNVLQHTERPFQVIKKAQKAGKIIYLFEWLETGVNEGHIHTLTEEKLNKWLGGEGKVEVLNESGCVGKCYYGIFLGDNYEKI